MARIALSLLLLPFLFGTTCRTKEMVAHQIQVENRLTERIALLPSRIKYDYYKTDFTKQRLLFNYSIDSMSSKKTFHTSFCLERFWKSTVVGDTLVVLVFKHNQLESSSKNLSQMIFDEEYFATLKLTYKTLIEDGCHIIIEKDLNKPKSHLP